MFQERHSIVTGYFFNLYDRSWAPQFSAAEIISNEMRWRRCRVRWWADCDFFSLYDRPWGSRHSPVEIIIMEGGWRQRRLG